MLSIVLSRFSRCQITYCKPEGTRHESYENLKSGDRSQLLYAALELRFALERMTTHQILMADKASNRMIDESHPSKQLANMHKLDERSAKPHDFYAILQHSGERIKIASYKPLDKKRVSEIIGRLGDLLHPKLGLRLGIPDDAYYIQTRQFLTQTAQYLEELLADNTSFFSFSNLSHIEAVESNVR